jgi:hypothetical protein
LPCDRTRNFSLALRALTKKSIAKENDLDWKTICGNEFSSQIASPMHLRNECLRYLRLHLWTYLVSEFVMNYLLPWSGFFDV